MTSTEDRRRRLLDVLIEQSLRFGTFTLASGATSDYYIDGKHTTLHPEGLNCLSHLLLDRIDALAEPLDALGGVTLGGDPIVGAMAALSFERGKPRRAFIIRKAQKEHGTGKLIEGIELTGSMRVAIIEDVVSTGGSALRAAESVRATGAKVTHAFAVVDRDMGAEAAFKDAGIEYQALFSKEELLDHAENRGLRPSTR